MRTIYNKAKLSSFSILIICFGALQYSNAQCPTPNMVNTTPGVSPNGLVNVVFQWNATNGADHYFLLYRISGENTWQKVRTSSTSFFIDGLIANAQYEWGLSSFCDEEETIQSELIFGNFTTLNGLSCEAPTGFTASPGMSVEGFSNVTFTWNAVPAANHYLVLWRIVGTPTWQKTRTSSTTFVVNGLVADTQYEWGVFTSCSEDETAKSTFLSGIFTSSAGISCETPTDLSATTDISTNGLINVTFNWSSVPSSDHYRVIWRPLGSTNWQSEETTSNSLFIEGLLGLVNYEWGVHTFCDEEETIKSTIAFETFTTPSGPCNPTTNLDATSSVDVNGFNSVHLTWSEVPTADHYLVIYKHEGAENWKKARTSDNSLLLEGLTSMSNFRWGVSTFCNSSESIQSIFIFNNFTTLDGISCDVPTGLSASPSVSTNDLINASVNWDVVGPADHYFIIYRPIGETIWQKARSETNSVILNGLLESTDYEYGISTFCNSSETIQSSFVFDTFSTPSGNSCGSPTNLIASVGVSANSLVNVDLSWTGVATADHYLVLHRIVGQNTWQKNRTTESTLFIDGLVSNTQYEWGVFTECTADESAESTFAMGTFKTLNGLSCSTPSGLIADVGLTNASLSWNTVPAGDHFLVLYRISGESVWKKVTSTTNSVMISELAEGTNYEWGVSTFCDEDENAQSTFTFSQFTTNQAPINSPSETYIEAKLYPNPASDKSTLNFRMIKEDYVSVVIFNQVGNVIAKLFEGKAIKDKEYKLNIDVSGLNPGIYYFRLVSLNGIIDTGQIVVQR